jgi:hypothetical protein
MSSTELLELLRQASEGSKIEKKAVRELDLNDVPPQARKVADEAWHLLMHYAEDDDIRTRDADYAKDQMETADWYEEKLRVLLR